MCDVSDGSPKRTDISFAAGRMIIDVAKPAETIDILVDGVKLPKTSWYVDNVQNAISVDVPGFVFDGLTHQVCVIDSVMKPDVFVEHRSQYVGYIEKIDQYRAVGWIYDTTRNDVTIDFDLIIDGKVIGTISANEYRHDLLESGHSVALAGFSIDFPQFLADALPHIVGFRIVGSGLNPFGVHLVNATPSSVAVYGMYPDVDRAWQFPTRLFANGVRRWIADNNGGANKSQIGQSLRLLPDWTFTQIGVPHVDIIIPVYRGLAETIACIASVIESNCRTQFSIIVIDDNSPDPELSSILRIWSEEGHFTYIRHARNQGFVATVNDGMKLHPDRDVVC